ncbi:cadherin domain-containing protein [Arenibacter sp. BSSL-BM3]|uniref:Cadherin domain-containing protein n=1 Tax=Arenibacter arenosicollis TaxID=2762274 RepID=A0ABR7QQC4_9FLAO|nr:cadherin domain-containing protein [Arenibacter arenosicollis]MBC8769385.1 cadherin domain-containing protein [Arenibacter arenosicollis]
MTKLIPPSSGVKACWKYYRLLGIKINQVSIFKNLYATLFFVLGINFSFGQLSDLHYLPPLKQISSNTVVQYQALYLSTPETSPFIVQVYGGTSTTPLTTLTISNTNPAEYSLPNGDNEITLVSNANTGIALSNSGLRFQSTDGQRFYVNYRGRSGYQAVSLTSKGRQALGTAFKWGGIPNQADGGSTNTSTTLGIMATEDNTVVEIFGYDPDTEFRLQNDPDGLTSDNIQITLNAGQSYVMEAIVSETNANIDGWLGASITSSKKIVISNGGMLMRSFIGSSGWDGGIDQPIPENVIGKEYVFVRGNGTSYTEFPVLIATQNNTDIYVNGSSTPFATINNGDYVVIPTSYYSTGSVGGNIFVKASKDIYAYQNTAGSSSDATSGMNFISPVNCLMPSSFDNIPDIRDAAGLTLDGGVTLVASANTPNSDIVITHGGGTITAASLTERPVIGSSEWKTFYAPGLTGNVKVNSTGPIAVGFLGASGVVGMAGYFSGFDTVPVVEVDVSGGGCLPGATLEVTAGFSSYTWYRDGEVIPDQTSNTYAPPIAGDYYVVVTKGACSYESAVASIFDCNPEIVLTNVADKASVLEGDTVKFTIELSYYGYTPVSNLEVNVDIPTGLSLVSATPSFGSYNNGFWNIGNILSGENHLLTITATVDEVFEDSDLTLTVDNTQTETDGNSIPDDLTETISVINNEIRVTKTARAAMDGSYGTLGEIIIYDLVVTNIGPNTLTNVNIVDTNADSGSITPATVVSLAPGASTNFVAEHTITTGDLTTGSVTNIAQARAALSNGYVITDDSDNPMDSTNNDNNGDGEPDDPTIVILNNRAPTDIILSNNSIIENSAIGTIIGNLGAVDPDSGDTDTYYLVSGTGDTDNGSFTIDGSGNLLLAMVPNYELQSTYYIRVRVMDSGDLTYEKQFTVSITDVNDAPTNIALSSASIAENSPEGTSVGTFSAIDEDTANTFTYSLVIGDGTNDADNISFTMNGSDLELAIVPDYEKQSSYAVYVNVNDGENDFQKAFIITISDFNEAPTDISLSSTSIAESSPVGTSVGTFSTTDQDTDDTFTYSLVTGDGSNDADNSSFAINGNDLELAIVPDYEQQTSYSVYVNVNDGENDFQKAFTITITDSKETPTDISLSNNSVAENSPVGTSVGTFLATDEDTDDTFTYSLVTGDGSNDTDNSSFAINGSKLELAIVPDYEHQSSYVVFVNVNDGLNDFQKIFIISITNINEAPTAISLSNNSVAENSLVGTKVGTFLTTDEDPANIFTYSLVTGDGNNDIDNSSFSMNGSDLELAIITDYEQKSSYAVYVNVNDGENNYQKSFTVKVTDLNDIPTDISLSNSSIMENSPIGTAVGVLTAMDQDNGNRHTYNLITGNGINDEDNSSFAINGSDLELAIVPDYEKQSSYSIYVNVNDGVNNYQKVFIITILDENEDMDGDGVSDDNDNCPNTPVGEIVGVNGCSESQKDRDNDGVNDADDNCPNISNTDQGDIDYDGIGDVCDNDIDGDGIPNEEDAFPYDAFGDLDNDGVLDDMDAFPFDPQESKDTNGDGIGDNRDSDDDGDGYSDEIELSEGTDQYDPSNYPADSDSDGIPDSVDDDDDNDGIPDSSDYFPKSSTPILIPAEAVTPNGDGNNDTWIIPGIDNYPNNHVKIFNRWGHEVYSALGYGNDWGGIYRQNSKKLPSGSYMYVIQLGNGTAPLRGWLFINY